MVDSLLGVELPLPVKLIVAFLIVLALIALATWVMRRMGGTTLATSAARGRQPRLAVIDAAAVDGRRRLVLIRRDNVEHLVMIGGPSDVVIEQNIVRAVPVAPPREPSVPRGAGLDVPFSASEHVSPPLPESIRPTSEPAPRATPPRFDSPPRSPRMPEPASRRSPPPDLPHNEPRPGLIRRSAEAMRAMSEPVRTRAFSSRSESEAVEVHPAPPMADANLADMAHRLEEALRRPTPPQAAEPAPVESPPPPKIEAEKPAENPSEPAELASTPTLPEVTPPTAPEAETNGGAQEETAATSQTTASGTTGADAKPAKADAKPGPQRSVFDSLEQEMASLLGRPPEKG
jgi:flagellar protein FliO/FliZ